MKKNCAIYINLPSEEIASKIVKRSVLIRDIIDVISEAKSYE